MAEFEGAHVLEDSTIALDPKEKRLIHIGDCFFATDCLGRTLKYQYLGVCLDGETRQFYLHNETWNSYIDVWIEWFNQRKIRKVRK